MYEYENALHKGKKAPNTQNIKNANFLSDGSLMSYKGGSVSELWQLIRERIQSKHNIAVKRLKEKRYHHIELCLCVVDGHIIDMNDLIYYLNDLERFVFDRVFFITSSLFLCYDKKNGLKEYSKKL